MGPHVRGVTRDNRETTRRLNRAQEATQGKPITPVCVGVFLVPICIIIVGLDDAKFSLKLNSH